MDGIISNRLTGTFQLAKVDWHIVGFEGNTVFLRVSGDASEILRDIGASGRYIVEYSGFSDNTGLPDDIDEMAKPGGGTFETEESAVENAKTLADLVLHRLKAEGISCRLFSGETSITLVIGEEYNAAHWELKPV